MANWSDPRTATGPYAGRGADTRGAAYDAGLRSYMLSVYNYMASGVLLTGVVALLFSGGGSMTSPAAQVLLGGGPIMWIVALSPLAIVLAMSFLQNRMSTATMQILYWSFAVLMGLSLSTIFFRYDPMSITQAFFATSAGFAGLSLWGYTTKKDLSGLGVFLIMGLFGLIVISLLNTFLFKSAGLGLGISIGGLLIFAGLTAYDTQKIKSMYAYVAGTDMMGKTVIMGALTLYLDFINMFLFLLRLMGGNRD